MKKFLYHLPLSLIFIIPLSCNSQTEEAIKKFIGGPCEGCEAIFEYGRKELKSIDTLPLFDSTESQIRISGTVFHNDGMTPAKDVILYIYHTNRQGIYPTNGDETGWAKNHGFIRGWIKTDSGGNYTFYTFRPASYPEGNEPEHIHLTVKEPEKNEYYLDDFVFSDDPLLQNTDSKTFRYRGGSGVMTPVLKDGIISIHRDIILGLNIPNYE